MRLKLSNRRGRFGWVMAYDKSTLQQSGMFATERPARTVPVCGSPDVRRRWTARATSMCSRAMATERLRRRQTISARPHSSSIRAMAWPDRLVHAQRVEHDGRQRPRPEQLRPAADSRYQPARRRRQDRHPVRAQLPATWATTTPPTARSSKRNPSARMVRWRPGVLATLQPPTAGRCCTTGAAATALKAYHI